MSSSEGASRRSSILRAACLCLLLVGGLWGAGGDAAAQIADQSSEANRQFVEAMRNIRQADQSYDLAEQGKFLKEADRLLTDIVTRLPESPLAVQLITGQFVGDFDYVDFKARIRGLACADGQSTACFLHRIEGLMQPLEHPIAAPRWDWLSLAIAHWHIGDKARTRPIISPFLVALRSASVTAESSQDLFLGRALALTGEVGLALDVTRKISDCSTRIYNLTDIAEAMVWQGEKEKAGEIAEEAADYARTNGCAWELGLVAQALLNVGAESRARTLFLNTVEEQFSRFKDRQGECCPPELAVAAGDLGDPNLALGLLRTVQEESPWTVPQVLGRLGARGETTLSLAYAEQVTDTELQAETFVSLIEGALRRSDPAQAEDLFRRLTEVTTAKAKEPVVLVQRARATKLLRHGETWRDLFQEALTEAERGPAASQRRDLAVPLLSALVEIETGKAMLE